jgi:predicted nucleotidyltransferase
VSAGPIWYFDTAPAWTEAIRAWAASEPRITRVWVFGSRATGSRTPKESPDPVPDLDVGYTVAPKATDAEESPFTFAMFSEDRWLVRLRAAIPVKVDLQFADPDDVVVWPAIEREGVLIYESVK